MPNLTDQKGSKNGNTTYLGRYLITNFSACLQAISSASEGIEYPGSFKSWRMHACITEPSTDAGVGQNMDYEVAV